MYQVVLSVEFQRGLKKLVKRNPALKSKISSVLKKLSTDLNNPSLRLHKLSGQQIWSISVTRDLRIIFNFEKDTVFCLRIGGHDEVY